MANTVNKNSNTSRDRNAGGKAWAVRRRIIVLSLIFCAFVVLYITLKGTDSRTNETIIQSAFALAGAVIGSYCFSAVWEDRGKMDVLVNNGPMTDINDNTVSVPPPTNSSGPVDNPDAPKK